MRTHSVSTAGDERRKTLRFKADGTKVIEEMDNSMSLVIDRVNLLLESYMGISDSDLGKSTGRIVSASFDIGEETRECPFSSPIYFLAQHNRFATWLTSKGIPVNSPRPSTNPI